MEGAAKVAEIWVEMETAWSKFPFPLWGVIGFAFYFFIPMILILYPPTGGPPPPCPGIFRNLPFFGYVLNLTKKPYLKLAQLTTIYGQYMKINILQRPFLHLSNADAIKKVFHDDQDDIFIEKPQTFSIFNWFTSGKGEKWQTFPLSFN